MWIARAILRSCFNSSCSFEVIQMYIELRPLGTICGIYIVTTTLVASKPLAHPILKLHSGGVNANAIEAPVGEVAVIRPSSCDTENNIC